MFSKKQHGATPEPDMVKLRAHQLRRQRRLKLAGATGQVLCETKLPESWEPLSNNDRYQMWRMRKGAMA